MNREELYNALMDEKIFPYEKMTIEERNYYLSIIKSCKDISDSDVKLGIDGKCEIIHLHFIKYDDFIHVNGHVSLGTFPNKENRCVDARIYFKDSKIIVKMEITRLCVNDIHKEYSVIDEFILENDEVKRVSKYDYKRRKITDSIENKQMKRRLK